MNIRCTKAIPVPPEVLQALGGCPSAFLVWCALRAMLPPARLGEWPTDATCRAGYRDLQTMMDPPLGLGAIRSGAARLVRYGWATKLQEGPGTKTIWTLLDPQAVLSAALRGAVESRVSALSSTGTALDSRGSAAEGTGSALHSTPPPTETETLGDKETDRDGRSSSSASPPGLDGSSPPGPSLASLGRSWVEGLTNDDLMVMPSPSDDFEGTWLSMTADERRDYLMDEDEPAVRPAELVGEVEPPAALPPEREHVRGVLVVRDPDGRITCGRYPAISAAAWEAALAAAGGPDRREDLIVGLDEVGGEVTVTAPDGHVRMVARWVANGERPRRSAHRPSAAGVPEAPPAGPTDWKTLTSLYGGGS